MEASDRFLGKHGQDTKAKPTKMPGAEANLANFLQDFFKPIRALLFLLLAVNAADEDLHLLNPAQFFDGLSEVAGGHDQADIMWHMESWDEDVAFPIELKLPEKDTSVTHYLHLAYDYAVSVLLFSGRAEHVSKYIFSPNNPVMVLEGLSTSRSNGAKHSPTAGVPQPSRAIQNETLYKLVMQVSVSAFPK